MDDPVTPPHVESTPVTRALKALGIPHRFFRHERPVHSLEQAASERGQRPEQVVRSILFRLAEDSYVMVLIAGPGQISWPALRKHLGQSRLTMASEQEVLAAAAQIAAKPPEALRIARDLMRGPREPLVARIEEETALFRQRLKSDEARAALVAFMERKR